MKQPKTLMIDDVKYVREDSINLEAPKLDGMNYVVVRSKDAGCFAGYLESKEGSSVVLKNSRRLWYWSGASSLSQLAMEGVKNPDDCKFPCEMTTQEVLGVCEIISATAAAKESINSVPVWKQ